MAPGSTLPIIQLLCAALHQIPPCQALLLTSPHGSRSLITIVVISPADCTCSLLPRGPRTPTPTSSQQLVPPQSALKNQHPNSLVTAAQSQKKREFSPVRLCLYQPLGVRAATAAGMKSAHVQRVRMFYLCALSVSLFCFGGRMSPGLTHQKCC